MYKVLLKEDLTPTVHHFEIEALEVAGKAQPGQFIMVMVDEKGERIPLSIADWDTSRGSISVVVSQVGQTTGKLGALKEGDSLAHFVGPLGKPAEISRFGNVACVAIGYGMATMVPIARALRKKGNKIYSIISAPTQADLFGVDRLKKVSDELTVTTTDGSYGETGWVIEPLRALLGREQIDKAFVIGSVCMMKMVSAVTREFGVKTMVSLNPIMVDGTGMCGACRVSVGGVTKFACVDGPAFDGHEVDWKELLQRRKTYMREEVIPLRTSRCEEHVIRSTE